MPNYHRKLLPEQDSDQITNTSDCLPTSPYNCDYVSFYWPPDPPPLPPPPTTNNDTAAAHISPYLIIIVALIAIAILFISYYFITIRYCARFRQPNTTQVNGESRNFMNEDHQPEIDHPIWYIATIGLQPAVINSITVIKFKKGDGLIEVKDCSVCLSEFEDDESLRLLPKCNHAFHISCIDAWLRSHKNCPLCRALVVANNSNSISQSYDQNGDHGSGLNRNTQMETQENDDGLSSNHVHESENNQDSKRENETMITLRRSFSMDSNSHNSVTESRRLNHIRDLRTRRMVMMVRSFSYGGS